MSKNYGQLGVGKDVQFGKKGNRIVSDADTFTVMDVEDALVRVKGADAENNDEFATLGQVDASITESGFLLEMGDPSTGDGDGSLDDGAIPIAPTDSVSNTIDRLNETLGLLVPAAPSNFPSGIIAQSGYISGNSPLLCNGAIPDNTAGGSIPITAGGNAASYRGTSNSLSSNTIQDNGPGNSGTITAFINNAGSGSLTFTDSTGNSVNANGLQVSDNDHFPRDTPGFWQSFDAKISNAIVSNGWNRYSISHSDGGSTNEIYALRDPITATPTVSGGAISEGTAGTLTQSSGVNHYQQNATLNVSNVSMTNLSGFTYRNGDPITLDDVRSGQDGLLSGTKTYSYASLGIATPINANTTNAVAVNQMGVTLDQSNVHGTGQIKYRGSNVNGDGTYVNITANDILYMAGNTTRVNENSISAFGVGSRVNLGLGDSPGDTPALALPGSPTAWNSSQSLAAAGFLSEAAVVGGIMSSNRTNYQTGFLPSAQPNYTGKTSDQYFDFSFVETAKSGFNINITGSYSGLWVGLPGISDDNGQSPAALGGTWWSASALYNGAGFPGRAGDSGAGCANGSVASGGTGTTAITFGSASSTNATNNRIYIRIKLSAGQSISSISIN